MVSGVERCVFRMLRKSEKLFGVKGSEAYKFLGFSHNLYGSEEKDYLKNWPNINSYFPKTEEECIENILKEYERKGPAYFSI